MASFPDGGDSTDSKAFNKIKEFFTGHGSTIETLTGPDDPIYDMNRSKRRVALILNNSNFSGSPHLTRTGSDIDVRNLQRTLTELSFEVTTKQDLSLAEIRGTLERLASENHSGASCVLVAILSHGVQNGVACSDNQIYRLDEFYELFAADKCETLTGKPKMLIVQACQGEASDSGTTLRATSRTASDSSSNKSYKIPNRADFITVFSTVPGYVSFLNPVHGSWLIQALTQVLPAHAGSLDFLTMMTYVAREVANFESVHQDPAYHSKKQAPYIVSTLTREIWL